MKPVSLIFLLWYGGLFCDQSQAQTIFLDHGKILFEKRVNMYSFLQTDDAGTFENYNTQYRKDKPQFATSLFFLSFKNERLLYKRARESKEPGNTLFWKYFDADNIVYSDLANQKKTTQKNVFEEKFLLADSISNIKWKITNFTIQTRRYFARTDIEKFINQKRF